MHLLHRIRLTLLIPQRKINKEKLYTVLLEQTAFKPGTIILHTVRFESIGTERQSLLFFYTLKTFVFQR